MHQYKKLIIWQNSCQFIKEIYLESRPFPIEERYGLTNQIRRASVSIASNIAEGASRNSNKEFSRYLEIALGSAFEVETQLLISYELNYLTEASYNSLNNQIESIIRQTRTFKQKLHVEAQSNIQNPKSNI